MNDDLAPVIPLRPRQDYQPALSYRQLSNHLGVSERFLRGCIAEGMPAHWNWSGKKRVFQLGEVEEWLRRRQEQRSR